MRITNSTLVGWTKTGKGEYTHIDGHTVRKVNGLWVVGGPNKNAGNAYTTLWVATQAAAQTPAIFVR